METRFCFSPSWGVYDMAVGESIISAFSGIADPNSFGQQFEVPKEKTHKIQYSAEQLELFTLYEEVRKMRRSKRVDSVRLKTIFGKLVLNFPNDWLLVLEIYEILYPEENSDTKQLVKSHLENSYDLEPIKHLIADGIKLINGEPY